MRGIVEMRSSIQLEERGIESAACRCYVAINSKPYVYDTMVNYGVTYPTLDATIERDSTRTRTSGVVSRFEWASSDTWNDPSKGITTGKRISGIVSLIC